MCRTEFVLQNKGVQKTGTMASVNNKAACYCVVANYAYMEIKVRVLILNCTKKNMKKYY